MLIGPKQFNGSIEIRYNENDECFYLRIGSFEAYLTHLEMDQVAAKGARALESRVCFAEPKRKNKR